MSREKARSPQQELEDRALRLEARLAYFNSISKQTTYDLKMGDFAKEISAIEQRRAVFLADYEKAPGMIAELGGQLETARKLLQNKGLVTRVMALRRKLVQAEEDAQHQQDAAQVREERRLTRAAKS